MNLLCGTSVARMGYCGLLLANVAMIQVRNLGSSDLEFVGVVQVAFSPSWCWWLISIALCVTLSFHLLMVFIRALYLLSSYFS